MDPGRRENLYLSLFLFMLNPLSPIPTVRFDYDDTAMKHYNTMNQKPDLFI